MRRVALLFIALLAAACVPEDDATLRLSDIAVYGPDGSHLYGYFYGAPTTLVGPAGRQYVLTEGTSPDPLAVDGALLVNDEPYLRQAIAPLERTLFLVQRVPFSTDLVLRTGPALEAVVYYDGNRWFTLAERPAAGTNARIVPRERLEGLRGLGGLTRNEARTFERAVAASGPVAVAFLAEPLAPPRVIGGIEEYRRTALVVQTRFTTDQTAYRPPTREVQWDVLATGQQAAVGEGPRFELATSEERLLRIWNAAYGTQLTPPPLPAVDFRRDTVVGFFLGQRPTGGYSVDVRDVTIEGNEVYIDVRVQQPGAGAITTQALTSPWVAVRVPRANLDAAWFRDAASGELLGVARRTR